MNNNELQDIISGKKQVRYGTAIQTILHYLRRSQEAGTLVENYKLIRQKEKERLIQFAIDHNLLIQDLDLSKYVSEGAEQKVYLNNDKTVIKLNDAIYYSSWYDYFLNILLNNYFFPDTAYDFRGFFIDIENLYAVVEQEFVKATQKTDLSLVKEFMLSNGFENVRNNDYYNPTLGIILEDLHDENVLTQNDILYFIDTVFYLISSKKA